MASSLPCRACCSHCESGGRAVRRRNVVEIHRRTNGSSACAGNFARRRLDCRRRPKGNGSPVDPGRPARSRRHCGSSGPGEPIGIFPRRTAACHDKLFRRGESLAIAQRRQAKDLAGLRPKNCEAGIPFDKLLATAASETSIWNIETGQKQSTLPQTGARPGLGGCERSWIAGVQRFRCRHPVVDVSTRNPTALPCAAGAIASPSPTTANRSPPPGKIPIFAFGMRPPAACCK